MSNEVDLREEILNKYNTLAMTPIEQVKNAMDEYFERRSMELLDFIVKNDVRSLLPFANDDREFYYKGEWITKEALFQNFL